MLLFSVLIYQVQAAELEHIAEWILEMSAKLTA